MQNQKFKDLWEQINAGEEVSDSDLYEALVMDADKRNGDLQKRRNVVVDLSLDEVVDEGKPKEGLF